MALQLIHTHTLSQCRLEMAHGNQLISRHKFFKHILATESRYDPALTLMLDHQVQNIDHARTPRSPQPSRAVRPS